MKYTRKEFPFYPDFNSVRKASEEAHIPYRPFTLGYIPQTYEDGKYIVDPAQEVGDGLPLKAIILDSLLPPGTVSKIKVITAFGLYDKLYEGSDRNEFAWFAVGIPANSELAPSTNELEDLQENFPWYLAGIRMYLNLYPNFKIVEYKPIEVISNMLENPILEQAQDKFPPLKDIVKMFQRELFAKVDSCLKYNDWFALGQPQFTVDALSIVEKSIKKFNLRDH